MCIIAAVVVGALVAVVVGFETTYPTDSGPEVMPPPVAAGVEQMVGCGVMVTVPEEADEDRVSIEVFVVQVLLAVKVALSTASCW